MRTVFMGTPEFAVPCLDALVAGGHEVAAAFCQPDKPKGRGYELAPPPVKVRALEHGITVYQPVTLRDGVAFEILKEINPDLIVVTAYGKILPESIINLPKFGCINIHASLLPKYRGAAPIQWSVINGEKTAGVTSMLMDVGLDTGDMLLRSEVEIGENETAGELHDRLSLVGAELLTRTLEALERGELVPVKQDDSLSNYAPMLSKELCPIDWSRPAAEVHNKIRGLSPWPVAQTVLAGRQVKVFSSRLCDDAGARAGDIIESDKRLVISCGDGRCVELTSLQMQGKKRMPAADFLRGFKVNT